MLVLFKGKVIVICKKSICALFCQWKLYLSVTWLELAIDENVRSGGRENDASVTCQSKSRDLTATGITFSPSPGNRLVYSPSPCSLGLCLSSIEITSKVYFIPRGYSPLLYPYFSLLHPLTCLSFPHCPHSPLFPSSPSSVCLTNAVITFPASYVRHKGGLIPIPCHGRKGNLAVFMILLSRAFNRLCMGKGNVHSWIRSYQGDGAPA